MTLKIALSGAQGTGKTYIVNSVRERIGDALSVTTLPSPTRRVKAMGYPINEEGSWETQLLSGVLRVVQQREALVLDNPDLILSDRCLADEIGYGVTQELVYSKKKGLPYRPAKSWNFLTVTQGILSELFLQDMRSYWDMVFYKPIHPDHSVEDDGDRSGSSDYQSLVDEQILATLDSHNIPYGILPEDRDESANVVYKYITTSL